MIRSSGISCSAIPSEYAFQTIVTGPAPRPEPPHAAPSRIDAEGVVKRYGLASPEDIDSYLKQFGFPASLGYSGRVRHHVSGGSSAQLRTMYDLCKVQEWEDGVLALAARIRKAR
jgi:hypothetical protein